MNRILTFRSLLPGVMCFIAISGCQRQAQPEESPEAESAVPPVLVVHPTRQTITREIKQPGWIRSYEQTPIYSKIAGYVEKVNVDINNHVKRGDLLLKMWVPEMEQDYNAKIARVHQAEAEIKQAHQGLQAAEANVNTAEASVKEMAAGILQAKAELGRWEKELARANNLIKERIYDNQTRDEMLNQKEQSEAGVVKAEAKHAFAKAALAESKAKQLKAEADLEAARARLKVAEADRDQSKAWLDYREIRAPYDGVVTLRNVHTGHFLQSSSSGTTNKAAEPLFVMVREDLMRINAQIPEYDAELVKQGMPAVVRFPRTNLPEYSGKVTITSWSLDDQARTLRAEIHLPNPRPEELLRPGMFANVIITAQVPDALTLPGEALMNEGDSVYCYVIEGGKAVRTAVQVGVKSDRLTQVKRKQERHIGDPKSDKWEEFTGREEIVARNPTSLIDGQSVTTSNVQQGR